MKAKTLVLNGMPNAGNSHVQFDEGEAASVNPRRGSLFCKILIALAIACGVVAAYAADYYWTGVAEDNLLATAENWNDAGGTPMTKSPGTSDTLVFDGIAADITLIYPKVKYDRLVATNLAATITLTPETSAGSFQIGDGGVFMRGTSGGVTINAGVSMSGEKPFDIGKGLTFLTGNGHLQSLASGDHLVKKGEGDFKMDDNTGHRIYASGGIFELAEGLFYSGKGKDDKGFTNINFLVSGAAEKSISWNVSRELYYRTDAKGTVMGSWTETPESEGHLAMSGSLALIGDRPDERMSASFSSGTATLRYAPNTDATLTLVRGLCDNSKQTFLVQSGKVRVAEGYAITSMSEANVEGSGQLVVAADAGALYGFRPRLKGATSKLVIEEGVRCNIASVTAVEGAKVCVPKNSMVYFGSISYAGVSMGGGLFTKSNCDWIEGEGEVIVGYGKEPSESVAATWTGNGHANTSILCPANWGEEDAADLPDFAAASVIATFPATATVTIPAGETVYLKGVVVRDGVSGDVFTLNGAGLLQLGSQGVRTETLDGAGALSIASRLCLMCAQTWQVGVSNAITFETTARLQSVSGVVWTSRGAEAGTKAGAGVMRICCSNPYLGDSVLYHAVTVEADSALGGPSASVKIDASHYQTYALTAKDCTLPNALVEVQNQNNNVNNRGLYVPSGTVVLKGCYRSYGGNINTWEVADDAVLRFEGGVWAMRNLNPAQRFSMRGTGAAFVLGGSAELRKLYLYDGGEMTFGVVGNEVERGIHLSGSSTLHTTEANAFVCGTAGENRDYVLAVSILSSSVWDLHGKDQTVQALLGADGGTVTSDADATVRILANATYKTSSQAAESEPTLTGKDLTVDSCVFAGGAGLLKDGPNDHTCCGVSTSTGRVAVVQGTLAFVPGASWKNASAVSVSGTGKLTVPDGKVFGKGAAMTIDTTEGAAVEIPAGRVLRVASLTVDGTPVKGAYKGAGVTGGGKIFVGTPGIVVVVK